MQAGRRRPSVTLTGIKKAYGNFNALDDVCLKIASGEFLTLLGPSGSGKTTLLMALAGFVRPNQGLIKLDSQDIGHLPPHKRDIGLVFQHYALFPHMNVFQNIAYPLRRRKYPNTEVERRVREVLSLVQMEGFETRSVDEMSGGQRQRVALARAVVFEPQLLLMDEPLSALDKKLREQMQIEIRRIHDTLGMTTIYVTHDQKEALTLSDRVAVMHEGRIVQVDTPKQIYERPASHFVADFIGESSFVPVRFENGDVLVGQQFIRIVGKIPCKEGQGLLVLRPEKLTINSADSDQESELINSLLGEVEDIIYQGDSVLLVAKLDCGVVVSIRLSTRRDEASILPEVGARIQVQFHSADAILVEC